MKEQVEILLTTYNTDEKYLKKQIDSILNQTYQNFTLLISDDASTKKEIKKILEEYQKKDKRIKLYLQEKNIGYNKNFEFLLKQANAKYIMFSDHDDIWYPQKVEKSIEKIQKEGVDLVYSNAHQINEEDQIIQQDYFKYKNVPLIEKKSKLAISRCIGIGCSQIITDTVKNEMIPFKKEVIAHDWLAAYIANEKKGMAYIKEPLFGYRLHSNNVFGGRNLKQNLTIWKTENGKSFKSFLRYRKEKVIDKAYLDGAKMCFAYAKIPEHKKFLTEIIAYYENLEKSKIINRHLFQYFKFLAEKKLGKKMLKEIIIFHFPILGYLIYLL